MIARPQRQFDGVLCFGGVDWWYHNRGHYDLRLTRLLAKSVPVLYVNSLGMRTPAVREGAMFLKRVLRKTRSFSRGLTEVETNFHVLSPIYTPGGRAEALLRSALRRQVQTAMKKLGIQRPLIWVACPTAARIAFDIPSAGVLFQRTDRFEAFDQDASGAITSDCARLLAESDLSLYCSRSLMGSEQAKRSAFVDHGVDLTSFTDAGLKVGELPPGMESLGGAIGPKVGFVGGIDAHTFDLDLFQKVARHLPCHQFVLVGSDSYPPGTFDMPNVTRVPQVAPDQVPRYLAACDVLIMPWNQSPWIKDCNPVKLKEYLAVGRPVVARPFNELDHYKGLVVAADHWEDFADAVALSTRLPFSPRPGQYRIRTESWEGKAAEVLKHLQVLGLAPRVWADRGISLFSTGSPCGT